MTDEAEKLTPEGIRAIRERLGLSQADAGELLGGGPRAFAKYEGGVIEPAASLITLLRLLDSNPKLLDGLGQRKSIPAPRGELGPFEVSGRHIAELKDRQAATLLRRLLAAEALAHGIPLDRIHVSANTNAPDGGEDGAISWTGDPSRTKFMAGSNNQFQLKTGKLTPAGAGAELIGSDGAVKPMIKRVLKQGGNYVLLCFQSYVRAEIIRREERMRKALTDAGLEVAAEKVAFRDADQIAEWVNQYPSVATWVLEQTQPGALGPFRSWKHWTERPEHEGSPFIADPRLEPLAAKIRQSAAIARSVTRVVGNSGIGKTRLVQEALGPTEAEEKAGADLSSLVMYAVEDEFGAVAIRSAVQKLVDSGTRAIIVVDRCPADTHKIISSMARRAGSRLSLLTIDDEIPPDAGEIDDSLVVVRDDAASDGDLVILRNAPGEVVEGIIKGAGKKIRPDDHRRLVSLADGYPAVAVQVAQNWADDPASIMGDDDLVDRIILGRSPVDPDGVRKAAMLLSVFGAVGLHPPADRELVAIGKARLGMTEDQLRSAIHHLLRRGVAQQRGSSITIKPRPVALNLARRQWLSWSHPQWERVLTSASLGNLCVRAAKQLSYLNTTATARAVVGVVCKRGGVIEQGIATESHLADVVSRLAEIDPDAIVTMFERVMDKVSPGAITGDVRRQWVWALEKIAFNARTFDQGARLLLRLAQHENETWGNNASGQFKALFRVDLGNTEADGAQRLLVIDEFIDSADPAVQDLIVEALIAGARMGGSYRVIGAELRGLLPAMRPWGPATWAEVWSYVSECTSRLAQFAKVDTAAGQKAKAALGRSLRTYISAKQIDLAETIVKDVAGDGAIYWPEAIESLGRVMVYDQSGVGKPIVEKVRKLIRQLTPDTLIDRAKHLVTEMSWDFPAGEKLDHDERGKRQREAVKEYAAEVVRHPETLRQLLPQLSRGSQRMSVVFGEAVAANVIHPAKWLGLLQKAVEEAPEVERNFDLLAGFCVGLATREPELLEKFKVEAAASPVFGPALPLICWRVGIADRDILLVLAALRAKRLQPLDLRAWAFGGELAKLPSFAVAPLFDALMETGEAGYWVSAELMAMYLHDRMKMSDELRPQLLKLARLVPTTRESHVDTMGAYNVETLLGYFLKKFPTDEDAREIARSLAANLAKSAGHDIAELYKPLLPTLLATYADLVWPVLGTAILSNQDKRWFFEHALADTFSKGEEGVAILHLPIEVLFAWCDAHPAQAPLFAARVLPMLEKVEGGNEHLQLHPTMKRLLDTFGANEDVLKMVGSGIHTYSWSGSMTTYYAMYKGPLTALLSHKTPSVRRWARKMLDDVKRSIESERTRDADWGLDLE